LVHLHFPNQLDISHLLSVGNPGAFTDVTLSLISLRTLKQSPTEPEEMALVDDPTSYFDGPMAESCRSTSEVVLENVDVVLEPNLRRMMKTPVEQEEQEEPPSQQKSVSIPFPVPIPVPNYDMPSYSMNLGSEQEVWGGEHDHPSSEDVDWVKRSPAPSIKFVLSFIKPSF
jgi:hypothetical protein